MGTLNLCLKVPKKMQKTRDESDISKLRKRTQKNGQHLYVIFFTVFECFLTPGLLNWFLFFSSVQAPWETSLEYLQRGPAEKKNKDANDHASIIILFYMYSVLLFWAAYFPRPEINKRKLIDFMPPLTNWRGRNQPETSWAGSATLGYKSWDRLMIQLGPSNTQKNSGASSCKLELARF